MNSGDAQQYISAETDISALQESKHYCFTLKPGTDAY
jgi:hypothetical protein